MRIRKRQPVDAVSRIPWFSQATTGPGHLLWPATAQVKEFDSNNAAENASSPRDCPEPFIFQDCQTISEPAEAEDIAHAQRSVPKEGKARTEMKITFGNECQIEAFTQAETALRCSTKSLLTKVDFVKEGGRFEGFQMEESEDWELNVPSEIAAGKDVNHPSNKPKESLLHSLFCVFSSLTGKAVLTAREALSKIIEEGLPGLDEGSVPSVQVAKVMRSNPYFIHLEGGKFFLCSGPVKQKRGKFVHNLDVLSQKAGFSLVQKSSQIRNAVKKEVEEMQDCTGTGNKRPKNRSCSNVDVGERKKSSSMEKREAASNVVPSRSKSKTSSKFTQSDSVQICKRYDGRGWKCHERALEGYSMCRHHHELIVNRLARLRSSGRLGTKKSVARKNSDKQVSGVSCETSVEQKAEETKVPWRRNVKARSLKCISS